MEDGLKGCSILSKISVLLISLIDLEVLNAGQDLFNDLLIGCVDIGQYPNGEGNKAYKRKEQGTDKLFKTVATGQEMPSK